MSDPAVEAACWLPSARAGDPEALGRLLEACHGYLLLIARDALDPALQAKGGASDLVQETFMEAQRDLKQFTGSSEAELLAWLRRLLMNNLTDFARRFRGAEKRDVGREVALARNNGSGDASSDWLAARTPTPSRQMMSQEAVAVLQQALGRLPDEYRRVILLRYQELHSFEEIGRLLDCTANAARKLWTRAVKRLQQEMEGSLP